MLLNIWFFSWFLTFGISMKAESAFICFYDPETTTKLWMMMKALFYLNLSYDETIKPCFHFHNHLSGPGRRLFLLDAKRNVFALRNFQPTVVYLWRFNSMAPSKYNANVAIVEFNAAVSLIAAPANLSIDSRGFHRLCKTKTANN